MRRQVYLLLGLIAMLSVTGARAADPEAAQAAIYGAYPTNYQEVVTKWLATQLVDAESAKIEWSGPPKPSVLGVGEKQHIAGYLVDFKVNARNQFGTYTGKQKHAALIRNGVVVKGVGFGF